MKDEFEQLGKIQTSFSAGLANISATIGQYGEILTADLKSAVPSSVAGQDARHTPAPAPDSRTHREAPTPAEASPPVSSSMHPSRESSDFEVRLGQKWLL